MNKQRYNDQSKPSSVLHGIDPSMDRGLDVRRLYALADFIEGLGTMVPMGRAGAKEWAPGPVQPTDWVKSHQRVVGYMLRPAATAYGLNCLLPSGESVQYLTGYGLLCWGWGNSQGMNAVAANGHVRELEWLLTAQPVVGGSVRGLMHLSEISCDMVADAIRHFVNDPVAREAWQAVAEGLTPTYVQEPEPVAPERVAPEPKLVPKAEPGPALTGVEQWKHLMAHDRYADAHAYANGRQHEIGERMAALEAECQAWHRRAQAALVMAGGE